MNVSVCMCVCVCVCCVDFILYGYYSVEPNIIASKIKQERGFSRPMIESTTC